MNQISVEMNVVETEVNEHAVSVAQMQDSITELNSAQLSLVGGGCGIICTL